MRSNRSRLALLGVLALALSVTVGPAVADAKRVTRTATGGAVPDAVDILGGPTVEGAAVPIEFKLKGKKVKKRQVADVDIQIAGAANAEGAAADLRYKLVSPNGDSVNWGVFIPFGITSFDVKWDNKSQLFACNPLFLQASDCLYATGATPANPGLGSLVGELDGGFLKNTFRINNPKGSWTLDVWDTFAGGITTLGNVSLTVNAIKKFAKE